MNSYFNKVSFKIMKLLKNQAGFNDTILVAIVGGIVGALFITGVFVWQEINGQNEMNNLVQEISSKIAYENHLEVDNQEKDNNEIIFPDSYFLTESEIPEGFIKKQGGGEVENLQMLDSAYGNINIGFVDSAYVVAYNKPGSPRDEIGVMMLKYIGAGVLDLEVEKIQAATGYETIPLATPSKDTEGLDEEQLDTWGFGSLDINQMNLTTTALIGAREDSIYLRYQDVLLIVWSDSSKNHSYVEEMSDTLKNKINGAQEIKTLDADALEKVFIYDGSVYYKNYMSGISKIAEATKDYDDPVNNFSYYEAKLSPNKKFILLGGKGWEVIVEKVYDIETEEIHRLDASSSMYGEWLEDNRIRIEGECGMGISCGIYESVDNEQPWVLEKIADYQ